MVYTVFYKTSSFAGYCFLNKNSIHPKRRDVFNFKHFEVTLVKFQICSFIADMKQSGYPTALDDRFFAYSFFIGILSAIFCSLFTGTEYSDGTIRNKIVVGHSRISIYLSLIHI